MAKGMSLEELAKLNNIEVPKKEKNGKYSNKNKKVEIFSYPYNFVELNSVGERKRYSKGNLSGNIKCRLTNHSPLFISGSKVDDGSGHKREYFLYDEKDYIIPASSIKGSIRSIFETVTASCVKNIEGERLEERKEIDDFKNKVYGIIKRLPTEQEDGLIVECDIARVSQEAVVKFKKLRNKKQIKEGWTPLRLSHSIKSYKTSESDRNAPVISNIDDFVDDNSIIYGGLFIGSQINKKDKEKIFFQKKDGRSIKLSMNEYKDIEYIINQRREREKKDDKKYGFESLESGDAIIFQLDSNGNAKNLAFSEIPRLRYKLSPYDLLKDEYKACKSREEACLTCRTFGMTGNAKENKTLTDKEKLEVSGRGKVYFTDARADRKVVDSNNGIQSEARLIKSLGEPHPTQKAFYLEKGRKVDSYDSNNMIRGRKFYWHHGDKLNIDYSKFKDSIKPEEKAKHNSSIQFMNYGNEFEFSIRYENMNQDEIEAFIYSIELEADMLHKIGKAKALGFGSCKIEIEEIIEDSKDKYMSFDYTTRRLEKKILKDNFLKSSYKDSEERRELRAIMNVNNSLDFKKSPFPEEYKKKIIRGEIIEVIKFDRNNKSTLNTLNWFMNMKKLHKGSFKLPKILNYK